MKRKKVKEKEKKEQRSNLTNSHPMLTFCFFGMEPTERHSL